MKFTEYIKEDSEVKQLNESAVSKKEIMDFLALGDKIANNWDESKLTDRRGYPKYLPSFDELMTDLDTFFMG